MGTEKEFTRLIAVGVLVLRVSDVEQLLPQGRVLSSQRTHGLRNVTQALGNLLRVHGQLV